MIPEITDNQLGLMRMVCTDSNMSVFSQCSAREEDPLTSKMEIERMATDADHLVSLGFLKNITESHPEQLADAESRTGRKWRVFEISALGRAMFQAATSTTIH